MTESHYKEDGGEAKCPFNHGSMRKMAEISPNSSTKLA